MNDKTERSLEDLLKVAVARAEQDAIAQDGAISPEQCETVSRLSGLIEAKRSVGSPNSVGRWAAPLIFFATLAIVSALFFLRVGATEVRIEAALSEIELRLAGSDGGAGEGVAFLEGIRLRELGISGAHDIVIRGTQNWTGIDEVTAEDSPLNLKITSIDGATTGQIVLSAIRLPPATRIILRPSSDVAGVWLTLEGKDIVVPFSLSGDLIFLSRRVETRSVVFSRPGFGEVRAGLDPLQLALKVADTGSVEVTAPIGLAGISFYRGRHDQRASAILSGTLAFDDLGGEAVELRPGQELRLAGFEGRLRALRLENGELLVDVEGRVTDLASGPSAASRSDSLMPTWFDWLRAQHGLSLMWGSALYLYGIAMVAFQWLRRQW